MHASSMIRVINGHTMNACSMLSIKSFPYVVFYFIICCEHIGINIKPRHEICNNVVCATSKASDQPAHTRSLFRAFASRLNIL